jgi:hypothetical protein
MKQTSTQRNKGGGHRMHIRKQPTPNAQQHPSKPHTTSMRNNNGKHQQCKMISTRNFIIQLTSWNKHDGRAITGKTVAGLHKTQLSQTLVNIPKMPSTTGIHKRTTILDIQKQRLRTPRQTHWTNHHSLWGNPNDIVNNNQKSKL